MRAGLWQVTGSGKSAPNVDIACETNRFRILLDEYVNFRTEGPLLRLRALRLLAPLIFTATGLVCWSGCSQAPTPSRHVGRTDDELRDRLRRERNITAASSWTDRATAEQVVAGALRAERGRV